MLPRYASLRVYNFRSRHYMLGNSLEGLHVKLSVVNIPRVSAWLADSDQQAVHANTAEKRDANPCDFLTFVIKMDLDLGLGFEQCDVLYFKKIYYFFTLV